VSARRRRIGTVQTSRRDGLPGRWFFIDVIADDSATVTRDRHTDGRTKIAGPTASAQAAVGCAFEGNGLC
jgi:hypothetical protein